MDKLYKCTGTVELRGWAKDEAQMAEVLLQLEQLLNHELCGCIYESTGVSIRVHVKSDITELEDV